MTRFPFTPGTVLAPMEGVTHPVFRAAMAARGGVGLLCTEFVRISRAPIGPAQLKTHVVKAPGVPLSVQLMGNDADDMADAARVLAEAGADVIDLNMGCPTKQASKNGVGAAMLKDPQLVFRVVSAIRAAVPCPVSVKMRAGFDEATHVLTLARAIEDAGADYLAVHPRLRRDHYNGVADWRVIARVKAAVSVPVIGNGDCWYAADALRMRRETGCDAVMLGRPAIRNPWIFIQIAALEAGEAPFRPSGVDLAAHLEETAAAYVGRYKDRALGPMKELTRYCARAIDDDHATVRALMRCQTIEALLEEARRTLAGVPAEALDLQAHGRLESSGRATPEAASRALCALVASDTAR